MSMIMTDGYVWDQTLRRWKDYEVARPESVHDNLDYGYLSHQHMVYIIDKE